MSVPEVTNVIAELVAGIRQSLADMQQQVSKAAEAAGIEQQRQRRPS